MVQCTLCLTTRFQTAWLAYQKRNNASHPIISFTSITGEDIKTLFSPQLNDLLHCMHRVNAGTGMHTYSLNSLPCFPSRAINEANSYHSHYIKKMHHRYPFNLYGIIHTCLSFVNTHVAVGSPNHKIFSALSLYQY